MTQDPSRWSYLPTSALLFPFPISQNYLVQIPAREILIRPIHLFQSRPYHGLLTSLCIDTIGSGTLFGPLKRVGPPDSNPGCLEGARGNADLGFGMCNAKKVKHT